MAFFQNNNDVETRLCSAVNDAIRVRDDNQLRSIVLLEPPFPPDHEELIQSLRSKYPAGDSSNARLEQLIRRVVTETAESEDDQGRPVQGWGAMVVFLLQWMTFLRDMDVGNLLHTYQQLNELQKQAQTALSHPTKGVLMLPTIISYARVFSRVAIGLDKRPELIQHLLAVTEEGKRESLPEKAANVVREAFTTCLNDRNTGPGGVDRNGKPDGKKVGIYKMANICLRILFQADKLESCEGIFTNIDATSPPLHIYPASERVTYLYYLGRYYFANTEFYTAQLALQKAYEDCPSAPQSIRQRRLILIYLVTANLILGRFPTEEVYNLPEAKDFRKHFKPITDAIRQGNLESFRRITNLDLTHPSAEWLSHYRIFYQIGNYCEVLVWRSLLRKVFLLTGQQIGGAMSNLAATLDLNAVLLAFQFCERRAKIKNAAMAAQDLGPGRSNQGHLFQDYASTTKSTYIDPDFAGVDGIQPYDHEMDLLEIECICGSLLTQGFLGGYISHKSQKVAIASSKRLGGPLKAGFPNPWEVVKSKNNDEVKGWKLDFRIEQPKVVNMSGARPAGA